MYPVDSLHTASGTNPILVIRKTEKVRLVLVPVSSSRMTLPVSPTNFVLLILSMSRKPSCPDIQTMFVYVWNQ